MGGLCSGRSDNPTSLEPPKSNSKGNEYEIGIPKAHGGDKNTAGVALHLDEYSLSPVGKL